MITKQTKRVAAESHTLLPVEKSPHCIFQGSYTATPQQLEDLTTHHAHPQQAWPPSQMRSNQLSMVLSVHHSAAPNPPHANMLLHLSQVLSSSHPSTNDQCHVAPGAIAHPLGMTTASTNRCVANQHGTPGQTQIWQDHPTACTLSLVPHEPHTVFHNPGLCRQVYSLHAGRKML